MEVVKCHTKEPGLCPKKIYENQVVDSQSDVCGFIIIYYNYLNQQLQVV